jgi:hypothetical protein
VTPLGSLIPTPVSARRMAPPCSLLLVLSALAIWIVPTGSPAGTLPRRTPGAPCAGSVVLGPDSSLGNSGLSAFLGRAWGETFVAKESLVTAISIWRLPHTIAMTPVQLFVTSVDVAGRPIATDILYASPVMAGTDSASYPIRIAFPINPPLQLSPGNTYFFAAKDAYCQANTWILSDTTDAYADGRAWETFPAFDCSGLGQPHAGNPAGPLLDLQFQIEFCSEVTPTRSSSWSKLKSIYR